MPRPARPDDLSRFRIPSDPRLSPDGRLVAFTLKTVAPRADGYRHSVWVVPTDGSAAARQLTLAPRNDRAGRFSPDGRTLAFLSDRRSLIDEPVPGARTAGAGGPAAPRHDAVQVHLLPLDGGEARRLTDLPRGVDSFAWSPDGRRLAVLSASLGDTDAADDRARGRQRKRADDDPPAPDLRYLDRLGYLANGQGFVDDQVAQLWVVDVSTGQARRLTRGRTEVRDPAWSPDGRRIAFSTDRRPGSDIRPLRSDVWVVEVESGHETRITGGEGIFENAAWTADGNAVLALGHRFPAYAGSRYDVWRFAADGSAAGAGDGRNLTARHDRLFASTMNSDVVPGEGARLVVVGAWVYVLGPDRGADDLWRVSVDDGALERVTEGRQYVSAFDAVAGPRGAARVAYLRSSATTTSDVYVLDVPARAGRRAEPARLTELNAELLAEVRLVEPEERRWEVDGHEIQGWYYPAMAAQAEPPRPRGGRSGEPRPSPLILEIHGGPHTHYGWAPVWEWQVLAGAGMGVLAANPRGSDGYTEVFNAANRRDWGDGPMRDVLAGVDALVAEGRADPDRLGVTGGSYGGYLTNWIIAKDHRFAAAVTCRSVTDMTNLMLTGDLMSGDWARMEFGAAPWEDTEYYREISPLTYAPAIRTPLLIQHSEQDIRTTVAQAEALFTVLRSLRRPVRFMRVPGETHELTRSGTPFRRVENLARIRDWFDWYLVQGRRRLPPKPRVRAGR